MKAHVYKNSFYSDKIPGSKKIIETTAEPVEYKGYKIFHRQKSSTPGGDIFDIVNDKEVCVGMYAGINGAKRAIDKFKK